MTSTISRLPGVPDRYIDRKELWIRSGLWANYQEAPYLMLSIHNLGYAERMILEMEERLAFIADEPRARTEKEILLMECSTHASLWTLGLYEIVRIVKDTNATKFAALKGLFHDLEILRMPLAKHELKSAPKYRGVIFYPTGGWFPDSGRVGWNVYDPSTENAKFITRTGLANEFLAVTAVEPIFESAIPVGGPLAR
jgi:hypothetical protein